MISLSLSVIQQTLAIEKDIGLSCSLNNDVSEIKGDRLELRRVITNLVGNAIKFTDKGSVSISLSQNESEVLVQVKDSGIGISPQEQQTIFQRYHQGNHRRSGKGLGLYLCQQIINAHQGKITVKSHLGKGTTFTVSVPKP